ncbi:MAG: 1-(5-phosphoribosyl)-5-[(5-phosphoribosylamino)methylideneamino] imidazole-4-carboxamide isomerase [Synergistaceae bacterium]|nr:1-(5-phosphoribosyl)-5-[(5-phosphoribosylamino)methylideneamino] imidazole-4-carboxamide isomerase [Synergistaceae bacterium]
MALILFPAIDLYEGKVIRLSEGDFSRKSYYELSPLDSAKKIQASGCDYIHIVDLEGAKLGEPCHLKVLEEIASLGMFTQYGGGLRSQNSIKSAIDSGANRVMIGSLLFKNSDMPTTIFAEFGSVAMPAIDIKKGKVVHSGWLENTEHTPEEAISTLKKVGFTVFLVTDTERDGMMSGIRSDLYTPLVGEGYEIVAAGGITTTKDINTLAEIGVSAAVVGKSLYEGGMTLEDALAAAKLKGE